MFKLIRAFFIAADAHKGQKDKGGKPYILHPMTVAKGVKGSDAKTVALLHDVLEDSDKYTEKDLDFLSQEQMEALKLLKKEPGADYFEYVNRIKTNPVAREVKLSDLRHNSQLSRIKHPTMKDLERRKKYIKARDILTD